jgi:integrase
MSLYKRARIWWADFSVYGVRYQVSTGASDRREAIQKERELIEQARKGQMPRKEFARKRLRDAIDLYLAERATDSLPSTVKKERQFLRPVATALGDLALNNITADLIFEYRSKRKERGLSNVTINIEVGALRRILKRAKLWSRFADDVRPLREPASEVGRAMSPKEKQRLLEVAASNPQWEAAYCAAILALNTTMRACEIRHLRWKDVDLLERKIAVRRSKTSAGLRVIPLNSAAMLAFQRLRERASKLGSADPDLYVFPTIEPGHFDPTKPMVSWRGAWRKLTGAAQTLIVLDRALRARASVLESSGDRAHLDRLKREGRFREINRWLQERAPDLSQEAKAGLACLRFHDLRHHAITELAERGEADLTIMSIAGHISRRMLEHYSHIRLDAKRAALDALDGALEQQAIPPSGETLTTNLPSKAH